MTSGRWCDDFVVRLSWETWLVEFRWHSVQVVEWKLKRCRSKNCSANVRELFAIIVIFRLLIQLFYRVESSKLKWRKLDKFDRKIKFSFSYFQSSYLFRFPNQIRLFYRNLSPSWFPCFWTAFLSHEQVLWNLSLQMIESNEKSTLVSR